MEQFEYGAFRPSEAEEEEIRKKAIDNGEDPARAVAAYREKLSQGTERLREKAGEKAREGLENAVRKSEQK